MSASSATIQSLLKMFLTTIINPLIPILIGLALLLFFYGLFNYLKTGLGEAKELDSAKSLMFWGVIILFVMLSVWGLVGILENIFFGGNPPTTLPNIPTFGVGTSNTTPNPDKRKWLR